MLKELSKCRVLVTPNSYGKYNSDLKIKLEEVVSEVIYNTIGKPLNSEDLIELLPGIDGFIAGLDEIDRLALNAADSLKVIVRYGVGIDKVDLEAASANGIIVSNTPGANSASVAELALCLVLMLARQIPVAQQAIGEGQWPRLPGISLQGKTIGILGLGAIGKQFALLLRGFDCHIIAHDPFADSGFANRNSIDLVSLDNLISKSDFISLHLPVLPETRGMVDESFIRKMKDGAYIINTSRGEIIDEIALINAIKSRKIKGAGLDAFTVEPPNKDNPLLSMPQVICTPHLGAQTDGATNNMGNMAFEECIRVLRGEEPLFQVN